MRCDSFLWVGLAVFLTTLGTAPSVGAEPGLMGLDKLNAWEEVLTDAERSRLRAAREKAKTENPELKQKAGQLGTLQDKAKAGDREAQRQWAKGMKELRSAWDAALRKADPGIQPILDKRDAWFQALKRRPGGGTKPSPTGVAN